MQRSQTWELTSQPERKKAIGLKWVYKTKYQLNGRVYKHKAWLVAKSYS